MNLSRRRLSKLEAHVRMYVVVNQWPSAAFASTGNSCGAAKYACIRSPCEGQMGLPVGVALAR